MNRALLILALAAAAIGCASGPDLESTQEAQIRELRDQNARLERMVVARQRVAAAGGARANGPRMIMPPVPRPDFIGGRPQFLGQLHKPIRGCSRSGRSIEVNNDFDPNHLRLLLDGEGVVILGARGPLPTLPPSEVLYLCVTPGQHQLSAIAHEPDGLTELDGRLRSGSVQFSTGAYPQVIRMEFADFELSD